MASSPHRGERVTVDGEYVFHDAAVEPELRRLRAIEALFDTGTQRHLLSTGESCSAIFYATVRALARKR